MLYFSQKHNIASILNLIFFIKFAYGTIYFQQYRVKRQYTDYDHGPLKNEPIKIGLNQNNNINIISRLGHTVQLPCFIYKNVQSTISPIWSKLSEKHRAKVLTIGTEQITVDLRFLVKVTNNMTQDNDDQKIELNDKFLNENWQLVIRKLNFEDQGVYQCSLPLKTPQAKNITLKILPDLTIHPKQAFVNVNQNFHIRCHTNITVTDQTLLNTKPYNENKLINWYKDDGLIMFNSLKNYKVHNHIQNSNKLTSELIIENAKYSDSGIYTCKYDSVHENSLITIVNENPGPESIKYEFSNGKNLGLNGHLLFLLSLSYVFFLFI